MKKHRMGVPQEYEPVLPEKIKAHFEKKKAEEKERQDMQKCYEAIKQARRIYRYEPSGRGYNLDGTKREGATHTHIPMEMWEVLQEVIEGDVE